MTNDAVIAAAQWLAQQQTPPQPIVVALRSRFNLTAREACEACAIAPSIRSGQKASA